MDSRRKFVFIYAIVSMVPFVVYTLLNVTDIGIFVISFAVIYFVVRFALVPRFRTTYDFIGIGLLVLFVYFVAEFVLNIIHP